MAHNEEILSFIEKYHYFWSNYIINELKSNDSINLINKIILKTGKQPGESVLLLLCIIRYILDEDEDLKYLENNRTFIPFILKNEDKILFLSTEKNVQANIPERALPIIEILHEKFKEEPVSVLELGASFGLIGYGLIHSNYILNNKEKYLQKDQQLPLKNRNIDSYLGIEINPPDKEWLLACINYKDRREKIKLLTENYSFNNNFNVIKGSAFGFSSIPEVKDFIKKNKNIIILTSFMIYQFTDEMKKTLIDEISRVITNHKINWINQKVDLTQNKKEKKYFIEYNNKKIISLSDDQCSAWKWI